MKNRQQGRKLRPLPTEASTTGRLFILFVALMLNSAIHVGVRHVTVVKVELCSPWDILDAPMSIRLHDYKEGHRSLEFFEAALDIFDELGYEVPAGCRLKSRMKPEKPLAKVQKMSRKSGKDLP